MGRGRVQGKKNVDRWRPACLTEPRKIADNTARTPSKSGDRLQSIRWGRERPHTAPRMNAPNTTDTQLDRTAPLALWRAAAAFMHVLAALFGGPGQIAAKHTLTLKAHQLLASWLRAGEAMMRRLLLIEAAAFPKPNTRPLLRTSRKRTRKLMHFFPETPEQWCVSFRCLLGDTHARPATLPSWPNAERACVSPGRSPEDPKPFIFREDRPLRRRANRAQRRRAKRMRAKPVLRQDREWLKHEAPLAFRSAWPLAERYEALRRVFANPHAHAQRLARTLHATPHRVHELLQPPPDAERHVDLSDFTETARRSWNTS